MAGLDEIVDAITPKSKGGKKKAVASATKAKGVKGKAAKGADAAAAMFEKHKKAIKLDLSHLLDKKDAQSKKRETFGCGCHACAKSTTKGKSAEVQQATMSWARYQAVTFWDKHHK